MYLKLLDESITLDLTNNKVKINTFQDKIIDFIS